MRTIIKVYKEHADAYAEFQKDMRQAVGTRKYRLYPSLMTFDSEGVKYVYTSFENWYKADLPKGEEVEVYLMCDDISDEEYYMASKEYYIYS